MSSEQPDGAEQLLNYLAMGLEPQAVIAQYLVVDEGVPLELAELVSWTISMERALKLAEKEIASDVGERYASDYWKEQYREIKEAEQDSGVESAAFELEVVREIINDE